MRTCFFNETFSAKKCFCIILKKIIWMIHYSITVKDRPFHSKSLCEFLKTKQNQSNSNTRKEYTKNRKKLNQLPKIFLYNQDKFEVGARIWLEFVSSFPSLSSHLNCNWIETRIHSWFLEPWNREKSLCNIRHRFSYLLDKWITKK